ncbi:MAG TPA: hypothetical protein VFL80_00825, partial [Thermoanaerobaculia bacterium]|nr:hypothetical protein [Thermoanaerobaculia bacterium]
MTRLRRTCFLLSLMLVAAAATAQMTPIELEFGYRWLDLKGSRAMYRSQINEQDGFVLRSLTFHLLSPESGATLVDSLRFDATDLGLGPASAMRLEAMRSDLYRLNLRYRKTDAFSNLPLFANPLVARGLTVGQHGFDRTRDLFDGDLEFLRWRSIKPFIGYSWNKYDGPGTTTYHVGQDEFLLLQDLHDTTREFRAGAGFELGAFSGEVTQGWRQVRGTESLSLAPGAPGGNNPGPVLGTPVTITELTRASRTDVDTPYTHAHVTGTASRARLMASFSRFSADSDRSDREDLTGSLASFAIGRFYSGLAETIRGNARNTTWRGSAKAELEITDTVDLLAGFQREHRELEGSALIDTIFLQSITFGGADLRDLQSIVTSANAMERDEDLLSMSVLARPRGPWSFRAGYAASTQQVTLSPDLSEIVISGNGQQGTYDRRVNTLDLGSTFARSGFLVTASWKHDDADMPILRTDFLDRNRYRVRAAWRAPRYVRFAATADETRQESNRPEIGYDAKIRQYSGDVEFAPIPSLTFR